jgi:hypothetical protein
LVNNIYGEIMNKIDLFQIIFGAGRHGIVYLWDIRGGRASTTFLSHKEVISVLCFFFVICYVMKKTILKISKESRLFGQILPL